MSESNFVFELIENEFKNGTNIAGGLVLETISKGDTLIIYRDSTTVEFIVDEIIFYGKAIDEIDRGMTTRLILYSSDNSELPSDIKYMYKL